MVSAFRYFAKIVMGNGDLQIFTSTNEDEDEGDIRLRYEKFGKVKSFLQIASNEFAEFVKQKGCDYPEDYPIERRDL